MTVQDLRKLIKFLPSQMQVGLINGDIINSPCHTDSGITEITNLKTGLPDYILLLAPCTCEVFEEELEVDVEELNKN